MITQKNELMKGNFVNGLLRGLSYIKYFNNNLEFFGDMVDNLKNGKGVIKFTNNYSFEGMFKNDQIDTTVELAKVISKEKETVEEGVYTASNDGSLGFIETSAKSYYILDFKNGLIRKAT